MFKKLIRRLMNWANSDSYSTEPVAYYNHGNSTSSRVKSLPGSVSGHNSIGDTELGFNFVIYNANGGKVIQCWHYDKNTDKQKSNLYLVHAEDDMATELSMIMTKESLSR